MAGFSTPMGLLALGSLVPLIILYILQPDPERLRVPTMEFLPNIDDEGGSNPILEMIRRNLLLLIQIAVLILAALALGSPFVEVTKSEAADKTVVVLDATASMAVEDGGTTRFARAKSRAAEEVTGRTTVVVVGSSTNVVVEQASASEARSAIKATTVTDASGSLASGISRGAALAGSDARLVVASDFSGTSDWQSAVKQAEARGTVIELAQFAGGGENNVGIVDTSFSGERITLEVANFGDGKVTRDVSLGEQTDSVTLEPGDVGSVTFNTPLGTSTAQLSSGDSFPTDDKAYIAGQPDSLEVLVVTSNENRFLIAALESMSNVNHKTAEPPVPNFKASQYDVVIFDQVETDRLLRRTVRRARQAARNGGGAIIIAQKDLNRLESTYGDLLPVDVGNMKPGDGTKVVSNERFVSKINFPTPRKYLGAKLTSGRSLVESASGDPLMATKNIGNGRSLYYGFMRGKTEFQNNFRYPVFWRDALNYVASRERLSSRNRQTGDRLSFPQETTVSTPSGEVTAASVVMNEAGFYEASTVYSANLLDEGESNVTAVDVEETQAGKTASQTLRQTVPFDLTPYVAVVAVLLVFGELALMRYRGSI